MPILIMVELFWQSRGGGFIQLVLTFFNWSLTQRQKITLVGKSSPLETLTVQQSLVI